MATAVDSLFDAAGALLALIIIAFMIVIAYVLSVMFWSILISVGFHIGGDPHSWWWACNHWGLLAPFVLG